MIALFPELEYGTFMNFAKPSKKGKKRFHAGSDIPLPLDKSMHVEAITNQLIKSNMREFVVAYANRVPALLLRFDDRDRKKTERFALQCRAEMHAKRLTSWPCCRYEIIMDFLYPGR